MRIAIHSDLHTDHHILGDDFLACDDFDVLILAGDLGNLSYVFGIVRERIGNEKPVIFVAGNHDYYDAEWGKDADYRIEHLCRLFGIIWLNRSTVTIDGLIFAGATAWPTLDSVLGYRTPLVDLVVKEGIGDFRYIKGFNVELMIEEGLKDREFFLNMANQSQPWFAISHICPLIALNNPKYPLTSISNYFTNEFVEAVYNQTSLKGWVYGHTHANVQRELADVQFYSNQRGYCNENTLTRHQPNYIIETK